MRRLIFILFICLICVAVNSQTRKELELQRSKTLEEISYVDNLLKETAREKNISLDQVRILGNKVSLRENVISGMKEEIDLLNKRIDLNEEAINMMESDLAEMKKEYANTIINSYKSEKGNPELGFILSARDFNQGYKRMKYLQQVTKYRHEEAITIEELITQIGISKQKLQEDLNNISDLKSREEKQKLLYLQEQERKKKLVNSFANKEKQLKKDLEEKKRIAGKIEGEISKMLEEERKKKVSAELTPEQKLIGDNFADNKLRLPWPVEKGIITSHFGVQQHPVLSNVKEDNIGIEITSSGQTKVRSIFKGQVMRVFPIAGANITIIIRHGKYFTIYQNLINIKVKQGDNVDSKQEIGEVYCDLANGAKSVLMFMIFDDKYLDPELWIAKRG